MVRILLDVGDTGLLVLVLLKDDETVAGCFRKILMNGERCVIRGCGELTSPWRN